MQHDDLRAEADRPLKRLSRGVSSSDYTLTYTAYKELYRLGPQVVPIVAGKLMEIDWRHARYSKVESIVV